MTIAGADLAGLNDAVGAAARFNNPVTVRRAPDASFYVSDWGNNRIRRLTAAGAVTTAAFQPGMVKPFALVFGADGTLFAQADADEIGATDGAAATLWRVDVQGGGTTSIVARGLEFTRGLTLASDGRFALAYTKRHVLVLLDPRSPTTTTALAGVRDQPGLVDGVGAAARFNTPSGLLRLPNGDLLVADSGNHVIRRVTPAGVVTTFAGSGTAGTQDGPLASATFTAPHALLRDALSGTIYVLEQGGTRVRRIRPDGQVLWVAGDGTAGFLDQADPRRAEFYGLEGGDVSADGRYLFLADGGRGRVETFDRYNRIRRVDTLSFPP